MTRKKGVAEMERYRHHTGGTKEIYDQSPITALKETDS